jgi:hypothetical protein
MKINEVALYENKSHRILKEGWQDLTESQQKHIGRWETELWPLLEQYQKLSEAELTKDQILAIFKGAEENAMATGNNKNALGKAGAGVAAAAKLPVDLAKKIDAKIKELGAMAKKSGPVKNMDAKFAELKKDISAKNSDSKVVQGIQTISDWAKENPGKATLAVGILTTIAAFAGGPAGGAAAGLILRATKDLLQGEDLSSAIGNSVKTAAYGAIAGWAINGLGDWLGGIRADAVPFEKAEGVSTVNLDFTKTVSSWGMTHEQQLVNMIVPDSMAEEITGMVAEMSKATAAGDHAGGIDIFDKLWAQAKEFNTGSDAYKQFVEDAAFTNEVAAAVAQANDTALQAIKGATEVMAATAQGSLQASGDDAKGEMKVDGKEVEPEQGELDLKGGENPKGTESIEEMTARLDLYLAEADPEQGELGLDNPNTFGAKLKRGAGALAGKAKDAAASATGAVKQVGKDLGNKVTANKLQKAWKKAGEPMDTGSIMNIMQDAGMDDDQISAVGQANKIELTPSAATSADPAQADTDKDGKDDATGEPMKATGKVVPQADTDKDGKDDATGEPMKAKAPGADAGKVAKASDGQEYTWLGAQWQNNTSKKMATKAIAQELGNPAKDGAAKDTAPPQADTDQDGKDDATGQPMKPAGAGQPATAGDPGTTTAIDLKTLAGEIKQAGPEVVALVIAQLTAKAPAAPAKAPVAKAKAPGAPTQAANVAARRKKVSASIDTEIDSLIAELDAVMR